MLIYNAETIYDTAIDKAISFVAINAASGVLSGLAQQNPGTALGLSIAATLYYHYNVVNKAHDLYDSTIEYFFSADAHPQVSGANNNPIPE